MIKRSIVSAVPNSVPNELTHYDHPGDEEDDIVMPTGPPPGEDEDEESDEDIPMPEGPPPGKEAVPPREYSSGSVIG